MEHEPTPLVTGSIDLYEVWDISSWTVMSQETRGLDAKDWVVPADAIAEQGQSHWWLFKPIKSASYRRYDDWSRRWLPSWPISSIYPPRASNSRVERTMRASSR